MSWFDVGAVVLVALAVWDGAKSGFWWAVLQLFVLLGAALIAGAVAPRAEPYVFKIAALPQGDLPWVTHLAVFALTGCSLFGVLLLVHPYTKKWRFARDRWFGGALGFVNGALAAVLAVALVLPVSAPGFEGELRASRLVPVASSMAGSFAAPLFPDHVVPRAAELAQ